MLRRWLASSHVRAWWGEPDEELALIEADIDDGPTDMRVIWLEDRPIGYVQDYPVRGRDATQYVGFPEGTRAVDALLGDPAWLGRGHGADFLCQRASEIVDAGHPAVVADPSPKNVCAVAAFRAAGFDGDTIRTDQDGNPVLVLQFRGRRR